MKKIRFDKGAKRIWFGFILEPGGYWHIQVGRWAIYHEGRQ